MYMLDGDGSNEAVNCVKLARTRTDKTYKFNALFSEGTDKI